MVKSVKPKMLKKDLMLPEDMVKQIEQKASRSYLTFSACARILIDRSLRAEKNLVK